MTINRADIIYYLNQALSASEFKPQLAALNACVTSSVAEMISSSDNAAPMDELNLQLKLSKSAKLRRLWTTCLAAAIDAPRVRKGNPNQITWLSAVPIVVTFADSNLGKSPSISLSATQTKQLVDTLKENHLSFANSVISVHPHLYPREVLERLDYMALARHIQAPLEHPLEKIEHPSVHLSQQTPCYRTRTLMLLLSSTCPPESSHPFCPDTSWISHEIEQTISNAMAHQNIHIQEVISAAPMPLFELLSQSFGVAEWEMEGNLINAKAQFGSAFSVCLRYYGAIGYAEIVGELPGGSLFPIVPLFSYFETESELIASIQRRCEPHQIPFSGSRCARFSVSDVIH